MAAKTLTDSVVSKLRPQNGQTTWREISDGGCRGLTLRLSPRGEKVWSLRVCIKGRHLRAIIGAYPTVSLAEARKRATEYVSAARDGHTPAGVDARVRAMSLTVKEAHSEYVSALAPGLRPNTIEAKKAMFRLHIDKVLGERPLRSIRRADVLNLVTAIAAKGHGVQATRVFSEMMALLRWCEQKEYVEGVPAIRKRDLRSFGAMKEKPRSRVLSDDEIAAAWRSSENLGPRSRDLIRLLLLTGQRRDEVRLMTWEEIDRGRALWIIPASRYKTKIDHSVPLSPEAMAIINARWKPGATGFVISGLKDTEPFCGQASALRRLQKAMRDYQPFTFHDLRRTVRTGMAQLGVDAETAERVLGHLPPGIQQVYDLYARLPERRQALELWAKHIIGLA